MDLKASNEEEEARTSMEDLPVEIVLEILSRIPSIKQLLRCRCVSKQWCNAVDHPFLADAHVKRSGTNGHEPPSVLLLSHHKKAVSFHLVQERGRTRTLQAIQNSTSDLPLKCSPEGSCNGLLCLSHNKKQGTIIILNPLQNKFMRLPQPNLHSPDGRGCWVNYGFGYDASNNTYKIVRIVSQCWVTEIYNLSSTGTSSSWREIAQVPPYPIHSKPVFAHGAVHWLVSPLYMSTESYSSSQMIVSFDVAKEKFRSTPHPKFQSGCTSLFQLLDFNGDLAIVDLSFSDRIEIWVADKDIKEWTKQYNIEIHGRGGNFDNGRVQVIGLWNTNEILLRCDEGFYIYKDNKGLRYIHNLGLESDSTLLIYHRPSLISISDIIGRYNESQ